jgi:hypothetical protein
MKLNACRRGLVEERSVCVFNQHGLDTSSMVYNLDRYQWSDEVD